MVEFASVLFVQFFVMRYIIDKLGIEALGIWSVLISTAGMAGFLGLGVTAGPGRFLSIAHGDNDREEIEKILSTIVLGTIPFYSFLAVSLYIPFYHGLSFILEGDALAQAQGLLVLALAAYTMQTVSATFSSSLTNLHRGFRKSQIAITGSILQGVLSVLLIERYGLAGLATAQISNYSFVALFSVALLKIEERVRLGRLLCWNGQHMKKIVFFGVKLEAASIGWSAFETSIRLVMARFGSVAAVGYYEVAYKIASQARIFIFYIGQNIGPVFTTMWSSNRKDFYSFFKTVYARLFVFSLCSVIGIVLISPVTSLIMLQEIKPVFLFFTCTTILAAALLIIAIPFKLAAISVGRLRYNILGNFAALGIFLCLGPVLGTLYQSEGVALAVLFASLFSAMVPVYYGHKKFDLNLYPALRENLQLKKLLLQFRRSI